MKRVLLEILACPRCGGPLSASGDADPIVDGTLQCDACRAVYPVRRSVPRFVDEGNYAASFGLQWNRFRATQLDSASGTGISAGRFYAETGWTPDWLAGKRVLDAGCGAGRFLEIAATAGAEAVGVDLSAAVDAAAVNLEAFPNAHIIQASLYALPFRPGVFDACYCIGVLQHTPDPARTLACLPPILRDGGRIAVVAYERKRWTRLNVKYLIRPFTSRLPQRALLRAIQWVMPFLFAVSEVLFRLPVIGRGFRFALPVANYTDEPRLSRRQRYEWAILDTFDMLSPAYDQPQKEADVVNALARAGIMALSRRQTSGLTIVGTRRGA